MALTKIDVQCNEIRSERTAPLANTPEKPAAQRQLWFLWLVIYHTCGAPLQRSSAASSSHLSWSPFPVRSPSVWCWAQGHVGYGPPSSCPSWGLMWCWWRRGNLSPETTFSTCGPSPFLTSVGSEPRRSTENSAPDLWITLVSGCLSNVS